MTKLNFEPKFGDVVVRMGSSATHPDHEFFLLRPTKTPSRWWSAICLNCCSLHSVVIELYQLKGEVK